MLHAAQVCLGAQLQEDDCAADSQQCWSVQKGGKSFSACRDTFRGYVCECPAGVSQLVSSKCTGFGASGPPHHHRILPAAPAVHLYRMTEWWGWSALCLRK